MNMKRIAGGVPMFIKAAELNAIASEYHSDEFSFLDAVIANMPEANDVNIISALSSFWIFSSLILKG